MTVDGDLLGRLAEHSRALAAAERSEVSVVWESWVSGPRSARLPEAVRKGAMAHRLVVRSLTTERRWLTETVFFCVTGPKPRVAAFQRSLRAGVAAWNVD